MGAQASQTGEEGQAGTVISATDMGKRGRRYAGEAKGDAAPPAPPHRRRGVARQGWDAGAGWWGGVLASTEGD